MSKNSIFATAVQTLSEVFFPHFYSVAKDFFETSAVPSDEADKHTTIVKALKRRDARGCVRAYTKLIEDLIAMYRRLESKETKKVVMDGA